MLNVLKKEYFQYLLKKGELKFNKDFKTTLRGSKYQKDFETFNLFDYFKLDIPFIKWIENQYYKLRDFNYPDELKFLLSKIWQEYPMSYTYIVGGAVRDIILDIEPKDYDIVTDIPYEELEKIFSNFPRKEVGKHFKVLMIKIGDRQFELANFRKDIYIKKEGKGADRVEIGTIDDDKMRRDFDVNCLYWNSYFEEFVDGNGTGLKSLYKKEFRFVGNPDERIQEDVLRLLRIGKLKKKGLSPTRDTIMAFRRNFNKLCLYGNPERIREHIEELCF